MDGASTHPERPLCGSNLESTGQNNRLRFGIVCLAIALGASAWLVQADVPRLYRVVLFVPFMLAAFGAWQGLFRTCPHLVAVGRREGAHGSEQPADPAESQAARRIARRVVAGSLATAAAATAVVVMLP